MHRPMNVKFSVVIKATYTLHPQFHHWQIFAHTRLLAVVHTSDNPMELGLDSIWGV